MVWALSLSTMKLIPHSLTPKEHKTGIRSLIGFGNAMHPATIQCSTPCLLSLEASPKAISRRTSYLRVRLAFHPYPQVIRYVLNRTRFAPPLNFTSTSRCPWIDHPVSGLGPQTLAPSSDSVSLRLRDSSLLILLTILTRWPVLQKVRYYRALNFVYPFRQCCVQFVL